MTRFSIKELVNFDPETERFIRLRKKGQSLSSQSIACASMENQEVENINPREVPPPVQIEDQFDEVAPRPANRILRNYARPDRFNCESSVRKPPVVANNFEIKTRLIQTIQQSCIFTGDASEDPHSHLIDFLELVETTKYNGVPPKAIKLRLFPFSLKGYAKTWLRSLPQGSITTWDQMTQKFLNKYFSPAKTTKLRQDISNFLQTDTESVYQAWEGLKAMLRKCPHHDIPEHMQLYIFYHGLKPSSKNVIDAVAGGSVMGKTTKEALQLLNEISENAIQWPSERIIIKKAAIVNQVDALNTLTQQIVSLAQKFETFQVNTQQPSQSEASDMCGGNHQNHECQETNHNDEHVNVISYKKYPFGSPTAYKHPGFQWSNPNGAENSQSFQKQQIQGPPGYQNPNHSQSNFRPYQQAGPYQQRPQQAHSSLDDLLYKYIKVTNEKMESQNSSLKNLEIQLSQLAALVSEKIQGPLPSNTEKNPKEHLKAITLRSGKDLDEPYADQSEQQVNN
uniref:Retrotransposon gag domain-containing protein n=1 Tax=Nicotiana tabacum TaxID=4097 RepID=A0A1S3X510_TOBAC